VQAHALEKRDGLRLRLPERLVVEQPRQRHVLPRRHRRDQVEELKDESDATAAELGGLRIAETGERDAVDDNLARSRLVERTENV